MLREGLRPSGSAEIGLELYLGFGFGVRIVLASTLGNALWFDQGLGKVYTTNQSPPPNTSIYVN